MKKLVCLVIVMMTLSITNVMAQKLEQKVCEPLSNKIAVAEVFDYFEGKGSITLIDFNQKSNYIKLLEFNILREKKIYLNGFSYQDDVEIVYLDFQNKLRRETFKNISIKFVSRNEMLIIDPYPLEYRFIFQNQSVLNTIKENY